MIEKYFMTGVRFKWWPSMPQDAGKPKDGSITDSPPGAATPLIYDGMDGELYNLAAPHVSAVGLTMRMSIPYTWLSYVHGRTARLSPVGDVLTGPMSGCPIAVWTDNGRRYVGHVGTIDGNDAVNKVVKATFAAAMPQNTTGFLPASAWDAAEIAKLAAKFKKYPGYNIMALVTAANEFHSILMFRLQGLQPGEWCVGGIKKLPSMNYQALKTELAR